MNVIHRWSVPMSCPDQGYAIEPVELRLLVGQGAAPGSDKAEVHFAIERCDRDRAGGERWIDVSTWSQTMALKHAHASPSYACVALLAAAVVQLAESRIG